MSISSDISASLSISRSEFLSSLPRWRRWLAKLNWHPTVDAQISALASERRMLRLESEIERIKSETEQLRKENARLAEIESKLDALLLSFDTSSPIPPAADSN